mmetsp:Transcript_10327/g.16734  ORF Transcript_10327/g.16734 Transcript_10327/m.16734 type:complete len:81 (+) Transcript_10327:60-302(+)
MRSSSSSSYHHQSCILAHSFLCANPHNETTGTDPLRWDFLPQETRELLKRPISARERGLADEAASSASSASWANSTCEIS